MNKKGLIQLIVSLIFFSITAYVMYGFFNTADNSDDLGTSQKSTATEIDIPSLLKRGFKIEQIDIFEKETFKKLKDNSEEIPVVKKSDVGKKNPFEFEE